MTRENNYHNPTLYLFNKEAKFIPFNDGKGKKFTGKYIMELKKFKHQQLYMNLFDLEYGNFERNPYIHQLPNTFKFTIEEVFLNL